MFYFLKSEFVNYKEENRDVSISENKSSGRPGVQTKVFLCAQIQTNKCLISNPNSQSNPRSKVQNTERAEQGQEQSSILSKVSTNSQSH